MNDHIGIVGGGQMGCGIAEAAARSGFAVTVVETAGQLARASTRIKSSVERSSAKGESSGAEAEEILDRIRFTAEYDALGDAGFVIEAVPEDVDLKRMVFGCIDEVVRTDDVVLASNTSSIPIAELARALRRPDRLIGLHFFHPVKAMKLVEIVPSISTSVDAITITEQVAQRLGKEAVVARDQAGFIVNALLFPYILAAIRMVESGGTIAGELDKAMVLGCGVPMGPLELADFVGLDTTLSIADALYEEYREPQYIAPPLLSRLVSAGRLGRKSGRGFYEYERD